MITHRISCTNNILLQIENAVKFSGTAIDDRDPYLSYSFIIDDSSVEFWNHKRKVSDLGIEDTIIPVGFKTIISEKLKRSFRFVSGGDDALSPVEKEPEFVSVDDYCLFKINKWQDTFFDIC